MQTFSVQKDITHKRREIKTSRFSLEKSNDKPTIITRVKTAIMVNTTNATSGVST